MKINLYIPHHLKIIVPVVKACKTPAAFLTNIFSANPVFIQNGAGIAHTQDACFNNSLTTTGTNHIYTNDAKPCDASFSFIPNKDITNNEYVAIARSARKNFITKNSSYAGPKANQASRMRVKDNKACLSKYILYI